MHWQQLLSPDDFSSPVPPAKTGSFPVPRFWESQVINGAPLTYQGVATFRLKVGMPPDGICPSIEIKNVLGASKIWLNGAVLAEDGIMGAGREVVREQVGTPLMHHAAKAGEMLEFVVQIANFHLNPLAIGQADLIAG